MVDEVLFYYLLWCVQEAVIYRWSLGSKIVLINIEFNVSTSWYAFTWTNHYNIPIFSYFIYILNLLLTENIAQHISRRWCVRRIEHWFFSCKRSIYFIQFWYLYLFLKILNVSLYLIIWSLVSWWRQLVKIKFLLTIQCIDVNPILLIWSFLFHCVEIDVLR